MTPAKEQRLVEEGFWGTVEYAITAGGDMPAREWLDDSPTAVAAKFSHLFRRMADFGKISNTQQFRSLQDDIWEFKRDKDRILCFQLRNRWILTHHFTKQKKKCPPAEIKRAATIKAEHTIIEQRENRSDG